MKAMINEVKRVLRRLTPEEVAAKELAEAELSKLQAETAVEYAKSVVLYNEQRIKRLRAFLAEVA